MSDIQELTNLILAFCKERNWKQLSPKDLALSLTLEAAEVVEHFQWKDETEIAAYVKTNKDDIGEELSDVLYGVLLLSHDLKIDLNSAFKRKMKKNAKKYPVKKS